MHTNSTTHWMQIWLDLRFLKDNIYSAFTLELVNWLIFVNKNYNFIIYTNSNLKWFDYTNVIIKNVWIKNFSFKEQTKYLKILKKDKNNLMLFFNHFKPIFYSWNYYTILPSLKDIYYNNFSNYFIKYTFNYLLDRNLKKSNKLICFDNNTKEELIEKYDIEEKKISFMKWFFPYSEKLQNTEDLWINIRTKYNLKNDYFVYSGWEWVEKNYEKLIWVFKKIKENWLNVDLVFLWWSVSKDLSLRNIIINNAMQENIHFMWVIKPAEKILFYKWAIWTIFTSFYEPFPFYLTEPLYFNIPIISSNLKNIKTIFGDSISYFSPISVNSIYEEVIKQKYSKENTIKELLEIMS